MKFEWIFRIKLLENLLPFRNGFLCAQLSVQCHREYIETIIFHATHDCGLNVFIGVFNLFPLLPLDGGHVAIIWFEKFRSWVASRRGLPDPGRVDYNKLLPVTYVVLLLFGGLTLLTLTADIVNPIRLG